MSGIYLHIPFCQKRCIYCDFFSSTRSGMKAEYVQALCQELEQRKDYLRGAAVETIYLGGGTPSQLNGEELHRIFDTLFRLYPVTPDAEITLEANPDDLTPDYISLLQSLPVNRLSMGVQTFDDRKLRMLNRRHTAGQAHEAVLRCSEAGFNNLSIDLIYGLPGETLSDWEHDLDEALSLPVQHLSAYHLMIEEGTPLWKLWQEHRVEEAEEELSLQQFERLTERLTQAGFEHYEISNFALPGRASRHNSSYWQGIPYLGCGASAHSFNGTSRRWNVSDLTAYMQGIRTGRPACETEELSPTTQYNEYVMTGLRTARGISLARIGERFGSRMLDYCLRMAAPHLQQGTLLREEDTLRLSHRGIFVSDGVMSDLMAV